LVQSRSDWLVRRVQSRSRSPQIGRTASPSTRSASAMTAPARRQVAATASRRARRSAQRPTNPTTADRVPHQVISSFHSPNAIHRVVVADAGEVGAWKRRDSFRVARCWTCCRLAFDDREVVGDFGFSERCDQTTSLLRDEGETIAAENAPTEQFPKRAQWTHDQEAPNS